MWKSHFFKIDLLFIDFLPYSLTFFFLKKKRSLKRINCCSTMNYCKSKWTLHSFACLDCWASILPLLLSQGIPSRCSVQGRLEVSFLKNTHSCVRYRVKLALNWERIMMVICFHVRRSEHFLQASKHIAGELKDRNQPILIMTRFLIHFV